MYGMMDGWMGGWVYGGIDGLIYFFKQETAYEFLDGLVGSEMCI